MFLPPQIEREFLKLIVPIARRLFPDGARLTIIVQHEADLSLMTQLDKGEFRDLLTSALTQLDGVTPHQAVDADTGVAISTINPNPKDKPS